MKVPTFRLVTIIAVIFSLLVTVPAQAVPPKPSGATPIGTTPLAQFGSALGQDVNSLSTFTLGGTPYVVVSGDIDGYKDATGASHAASQLFIIDANSGAYVAGATGITGGYVHTTYSLVTSDTSAIIYVGGTFTTVEGQSRNKLAAYDVTLAGGAVSIKLNSTWLPAGNGNIRTLDYGDGRVYLSGNQARAVNPTTGATIWQTTADCGIWALDYIDYTKSVYVGGNARVVGGVTGKGSFKLSASTGAVDKAFKPENKANLAGCGDYQGANALDFAWDDANKRLVECDGGKYNAVRSLNPKTGYKYWVHRLDGDAQTCTTVGAYTFVGIHRSGPNLSRFKYNYGNLGLVVGSKTGIQKVWQPKPDFTIQGGANRDGRNNGLIAGVVVGKKLFVGGASPSVANSGKSKLFVFAIK